MNCPLFLKAAITFFHPPRPLFFPQLWLAQRQSPPPCFLPYFSSWAVSQGACGEGRASPEQGGALSSEPLRAQRREPPFPRTFPGWVSRASHRRPPLSSPETFPGRFLFPPKYKNTSRGALRTAGTPHGLRMLFSKGFFQLTFRVSPLGSAPSSSLPYLRTLGMFQSSAVFVSLVHCSCTW